MKTRPAYFWSYAWPFVLVLVLVGSVPYIGPGSKTLREDVASGRYLLKYEKAGEDDVLNGTVFFEYVHQENGQGNEKIFKLHFLETGISKKSGFGFLIPLGNAEAPISMETYRVVPNDRGFLSGNNSVFGYADLQKGSDDLYFTESGKIVIKEVLGAEVCGIIDVVLEDHYGESLSIKGSFRARQLPQNLSL